MKVERVSEHIWSLKSWMGIPVTVWLVKAEDGVTLVDAGMPFMAKGILRQLENLNIGRLKRILLTHGHSDHVGSIKQIRSQFGTEVVVYAHPIEIPFMEGELLYPRRKKLEVNVEKGIARPIREDDGGLLESFGELRPYFTPGHSPGHVIYYHEKDNVLLAGDLFTSKRGKLHRPMPMFTADMEEAVRSSFIVERLQPERLEVCHGNAIHNPAAQLNEYVAQTVLSLRLTLNSEGQSDMEHVNK